MFQKILGPIDGSPTALEAVDRACAIAKAFGSSVTAVYVIDPYPFTGVGADFAYGQDQYLSAATAEANTAVDAAKQRFAAAGVKVETRVVESHAIWRGVMEVAESLGVDLIVMGSHGRRGLEKLVLGSVTQSVLAHSKISTLVVRSSDEPGS